MTLEIVTLGSVNVDLLVIGQAPTELSQLLDWVAPSQVTLTAAGSNGYTTLALAKLGLKTGVVSVLADDVLGEMLYQDLRQAGVDVSYVVRQPQTLSGIGIYLLLFGSKKRPLTYRLPTHDPWPRSLDEQTRAYLLSGRHVHCSGYLHFPDMWNNDLAEVFQAARRGGLTTSLDPQGVLSAYDGEWIDPLRGLLPYTDLLILDAIEAQYLTHQSDMEIAAYQLSSLGPRLVAVKVGAEGTVVCEAGQIFHQLAVPVPEEEIVETVGAGDTFDAGFIVGMLAGWPVKRCAKFAALAAASSLRGAGAVSRLASRQELERALDESGDD